ncbi:hypothetical protein ACIRBY_17175 [Streptomyces sp. NPDC096136]|uniref:hypothetical protein n=1 Tax=Streptomyces sp. NPDC096136 TaxID=3366076 RepID=UPI00381D4420
MDHDIILPVLVRPWGILSPLRQRRSALLGRLLYQEAIPGSVRRSAAEPIVRRLPRVAAFGQFRPDRTRGQLSQHPADNMPAVPDRTAHPGRGRQRLG